MATKSEETTKTTTTKKYFYANGKRKTAVARVKIFKGSGNITINTLFALLLGRIYRFLYSHRVFDIKNR